MRFTTLQQWLDWQTSLHAQSIDLGLDRVAAVWQRLHPEPLAPFVITVAGTNGKGSCMAMLEAILLSAGYRVGCFTSPHLVRYNERLRINGAEMDDQQIIAAFEQIDTAREAISLTYFEFGTLAALWGFTQAGVDVMLLEVGLGGRLDAVNIIDADAALISSIGLDHQQWLGNDRESIGREKAGVLRPGQPAVFAGEAIPSSIVDYAAKLETDLQIAGNDYLVSKQDDSWSLNSQRDGQSVHALPLPALRGQHQLANAAGVIALLQTCQSRLPVARQALREGLLAVSLQGRFQVMQLALPTVVDVAHNAEAISELVQNLRGFVVKGHLHVIIGMLKDKDLQASLRPLLALADAWYPLPTPGERGLSAQVLADRLHELGADSVTVCQDINSAYQQVQQAAGADDSILVTGSFLVAGDFLHHIVQAS